MPKFTTLVGLEISKMFHKKRIIFGIGFLMIVFTLMAYSSRPRANNFDGGRWHEENLRYELEHYQNELKNEQLPDEMKKEYQQRIKDIEYEIEVGYEKAQQTRWNSELEEIKKAVDNENNSPEQKKYFERRIKILEAQLEYGENSPQVQRLHSEDRLEQVKNELTQNQSPEQLARLKSEQRELELRMEQTQPEGKQNAFYLLTYFFSNVGSLLLPLVIVLVASESISGEYSLGTIKLLLIKPFTRIKLYLSKYTALMIYGAFVFAVVSVVGYIIGGLFVGFGGANLTRIAGRALVGNNHSYFPDYTKAFLVTNFQYLVIMLGLFLVMLTALVAFSMLISVFTKSATISLVATMGLVMAGNILSALLRNYGVTKYLLTSHINIMNYPDGGMMLPGVTITFSVVIVLLYTVLCLAGGMYSFKRRDIV